MSSLYYQTSPPVSPPRAYYTPSARYSSYSGRGSFGYDARPYSEYTGAQPYYAPTYQVPTTQLVTAVQPQYTTPMTYSYFPSSLTRFYRGNTYGNSYAYGQQRDDDCCCCCCGGDGRYDSSGHRSRGCCGCCGSSYSSYGSYSPYSRRRRDDDCC